MRYVCVAAVALCVVGLCSGLAISNGQNSGDEGFQITVAPSTIALGSSVDAVTVHSNIPAAAVVKGSVALNGVTLTSVWADDCGHLAARIALAKLLELPGIGIAPPSATLTLTCDLTNGPSVEASDTVKVVRISKK